MDSVLYKAALLFWVLVCLGSLGCSEDSKPVGGLLDGGLSPDVDDGGDVVEPTSDVLLFPDTNLGGDKDGDEGSQDTETGPDIVSDANSDVAEPEDVEDPAEDVEEPVEDVEEPVEDVEEPVEDVEEPEDDVAACVDDPSFPSLNEPLNIDGPAPNGVSTPIFVWHGDDVALFWTQNDDVGEPSVYLARMSLDGTYTKEPTLLWSGYGFQAVKWTGEEYGVFYGVSEEPNSTLRLQRVGQEGDLLGDPVIIATGSDGADLYIKDASYAEGVYTIFWNENTGVSPTYHQRFNTTGGVLSTPHDLASDVLPIVLYSISDVEEILSVKDALDTPLGVVSIVQVNSPSQGPSHWMVLHDELGAPTSLYPVPTGEDMDYLDMAQVIWNGTTFAVVQSGQPSNKVGVGFEVYFSLVDPEAGADDAVALSAGAAAFPQMAFSGDGYGVVWMGVGMEGIHFTRVGLDGSPDQEFGVVEAGDIEDAGDMLPQIAWVGDRYVVSWISYGTAYDSYVLFGNPVCAP